MIRLILIAVLSFVAFCSRAQSDYQQGYFIDINGTRQEGYVSMKPWSDNPRTFSFKTEPGSSSWTIAVNSATEVGAGGTRYVRFIGNVDNSSSKSRKMSTDRAPDWVADSLFLKLLVDGKADLFYCKRDDENRFFYRVDDAPISQLIFKLFDKATGKNEPSSIVRNNEYRNQLRAEVNCLQYSAKKISVLRYDIVVLTKYFTEQNMCSGGNEFTAKDEVSRRMTSVRVTPGINIAQMDSYTKKGQLYEAYEQKLSFRMGAEIEVKLPFHRKKLAVLLEPSVQSYKANGTDNASKSITYTSFELALGARYYFYLGKESSVFLNAAGVFDIPVECIGGWEGRNNAPGNSNKTFSMAAGVGGTYKRFSIEARYYSTRQMDGTAGMPAANGDTVLYLVTNEFQKISLILGFRIF